MNSQEIEQEIQEKGLTAPRITPAEIEGSITSEHYFTAADGLRVENKIEARKRWRRTVGSKATTMH